MTRDLDIVDFGRIGTQSPPPKSESIFRRETAVGCEPITHRFH